MGEETFGFRTVLRTGVIYVMEEALKMGYDSADLAWANLGQGSPETGIIPGDVRVQEELDLSDGSRHYSPVAGLNELRQKIADIYNELYRKNKTSKYTYKNVSVCNGGRLALTRVTASLGDINLGHFIPDYTAYEELLSLFKSFIPIPIQLNPQAGFNISIEELENEIIGKGLQALLLSNPGNPTGRLLCGEELKGWVDVARRNFCSIIFDEFYSSYIYKELPEGQFSVSASEYVEDVNKDPIIILDGLTKNQRLPGLRLGWIIGPEQIIESINSAGSFIDGGPNHPTQLFAMKFLDRSIKEHRAAILQRHFKHKRDIVLARLEILHLRPQFDPDGTFYVWVDLSNLPEPINDGMQFFRECLKEKVIIVPGEFFDVNPGKRRLYGKYTGFCRLSFGPNLETLQKGLDGIEAVLKKQKTADTVSLVAPRGIEPLFLG